MKYVKMLGLAALTAVAAMAFAATASATSLTSPEKSTYTGEIAAEVQGGGIVTHNSVETFTCQTSTAKGKVESHGASTTVKGAISSWNLSNCNNSTFTVLKLGTLEVHATSGGDGTLTSNGMEIKAVGPMMTCIYTTSNTDIGILTGSNSENATALVDSAKVPRTGGSALCGAYGELTGEYEVTSPGTLYVD